MSNEDRIIDNLIVGTGPAGLATAMALRRLGRSFEIVDVAYELEPTIAMQVEDLAREQVRDWSERSIRQLFPPSSASTQGVARRLCFGSDFPYRVPANFNVEMVDCASEFSHALGGLGNVWGAAVLPYTDDVLKDWPVDSRDLRPAYSRVLEYMPISGEKDDLDAEFPSCSRPLGALDRSPQIAHLFSAFGDRSDQLASKGIRFGRARVAVNSEGGAESCRYCGRCLDGCVFGSIFNPGAVAKSLEQDNIVIHHGHYALEFAEEEDVVTLAAIDLQGGALRQFRTRRLYLAAGQFATTRIIARSLALTNKPIRVIDSQYFFFPLLSFRRPAAEIRFTLAEAFLELPSGEVSNDAVHVQVYGKNPIFERVLRDLLPVRGFAQAVTDRLYLFQGFLHSRDSGHLEFTLARSGRMDDHVVLRGITNVRSKSVAKRVRSTIRRYMRSFGIIPPIGLNVVPPGRSFHTGGSFPMGGRHPTYHSDGLGRPAGLRRIHIMDAASFPTIAGSPIAFTIMANADRIASEVPRYFDNGVR